MAAVPLEKASRRFIVSPCSLKGFTPVNWLKFGNCIRGHELSPQLVELDFCLVDEDFFCLCMPSSTLVGVMCFILRPPWSVNHHHRFRQVSTLDYHFVPGSYCVYCTYHVPDWLLSHPAISTLGSHIPIENRTHSSTIASPTVTYDLEKTAITELFEVEGAPDVCHNALMKEMLPRTSRTNCYGHLISQDIALYLNFIPCCLW